MKALTMPKWQQWLMLLAVGATLTVSLNECEAGGPRTRADRIARYYAAQRPWHGPYANTSYGQPVALVVPPTSVFQNSWSWGVAQSEATPLYHQFHRDPGAGFGPGGGGYGGSPILPTPLWPSHTDQLGVYPVRGPW
ncbi:hypothetical protein NA78x_001519 [Anatilimnocola sp. NA78]|uniref:hypothetical protein n=1 Tax=Anatilimnocola sp. NA78 TaxID=3415683 RepID=UPI003CE48784